jgi:hypothetical protein
VILAATVVVASAASATACEDSDVALRYSQGVNCAAYVGDKAPSWCPANGVDPKLVHHDWPSQAVYTWSLLADLMAPTTCLNTTASAAVTTWLESEMVEAATHGSFGWTLLVFQPGYYTMPRREGERIESPWTLGMKCWAAAFLQQSWLPARDAFVAVLNRHNVNVSKVVGTMDYGTANAVSECGQVMANCFVNASYDPSRNGTCPLSMDDFHLGFDYQNGIHGKHVRFDFW